MSKHRARPIVLAALVSISTSIAFAQSTPAVDGVAAVAAPAAATPGDSGGLEAIVVTAQRRVENAQKAPIAIDIVSAATLTNAGVSDPSGLTALVPSVQFGKAAGPYYVYFLRGVGSNATSSLTDAAVALSLDGVPVARQYNTDGQFYDLQRVEVLEGPQGTLYGRNTTGGAINLIPQRPKHEYSADFGVGTGNYNELQSNGAVNVPLTDDLAARASFATTNHSGYLSDGEADDDTKSGRLQFLYDPNDALSFLLSGDMVNQGGRGGGSAIIGHGYSASDRIGLGDPRVLALEAAAGLETIPASSLYQNNKYSGVKGEMNWKSDLGTLTVIPAFRHADLDFAAVFGGGEKDQELDNQSSIEARFASTDEGFLRWIVGGFFLKDSVNADFQIDNLNKTGNQQLYNAGTKSGAGFADLTAHITDKFRLIGGLRDTRETKSLDGSLHNPFLAAPKYIYVDQAQTYTKVTWRAGAEYDVTDSSMAYATVATGFRSGGFYFSSDSSAFSPETMTAYTLGTKNRFLNDRLQANFELYDWEYKNQQLGYTGHDSQGDVVFATTNAGATRIRGFELDTKFRALSSTEVDLDVQYLNAAFQKFAFYQVAAALPGSLCSSVATPGKGFLLDCQGQTPPESPRWVVNPAVNQTFGLPNGGSLDLNANVHYQTKTYTAINYVPSDLQGSYFMENASLSYAPSDAKWSVTAYADNISNTTVQIFSTHTNFNTAQLLAPRTYGVRAQFHFQ
jgi:iron complex outermembrane recepter protein